MKNIHILPTDKPSRLVKFFTNKFHLCKEILPIQDEEQYQNIYITSDEEIKEGDYVIWNDKVYKDSKRSFIGVDYSQCKKIILTTDQDLIKDGIQPIDDEFLEWFVKNPSCERVEVRKYHQRGDVSFKDRYRIIIPQGEPKQIKCYCGHTITCDCEPLQEEPNKTHYLDELPNMDKKVLAKMWESAMPKLEPKQETLEEAADIFKNDRVAHGNDITYDNGFVDAAAKWQAERSQMIVPPDATNIEVFAIKPDENGKLFAYIGYKTSNGNFEFSTVPFTEPKPKRMYSEEDLKLILQLFVKDTRGNSPWVDADDEWFEQNKRR
jgi:hypothetical protein